MARTSKHNNTVNILLSELHTYRWRVGAYVRLSREDGDKVESDSITNQKDLIEGYLQEQDDMALYDIYSDDGFSGTTFDRPNFTRLMADIQAGTVNCIIVKDLSRFVRNYVLAGDFFDYQFPLLNIRFIAITDYVDSFLNPESMDDIGMILKNVTNELYAKDISRKVRGSLDRKRVKGLFVGNSAPYGYQKDAQDKYHLVKDETTSSIVADIYLWRLHGYSVDGICERLTASNIPTPAAYKVQQGLDGYTVHANGIKNLRWGSTTVKHILQDEVYLGHMIQGKTKKISHKVKKRIRVDTEKQFRVENTHDPIIEQELYDKVQETFDMDLRVSVSPFQNVVYPLSGFVRCGDCQMSMTRKISGKHNQYVYYVCSTHKVTPSACPTTHSILEEKLLNIVHAKLSQQIQTALAVDQALSYARTSVKNPTLGSIDNDIRATQKELTKWIDRQDSLYDDYKDGILPTREDYERQRARYDDRIKDGKEKITRLRKEQEILNKMIATGDSFVSKFKEYREMEEINREILTELVKSIIVHGNGEEQVVQVVFHFEDELKRVQEWLAENLKQETQPGFDAKEESLKQVELS